MPQPGTIAIVDDDASVRCATASLVRSLGHRVRSYASAAAYLAALCGGAGDCLITDVQMDGIGGLELSQQLRARGVDIPVVFITAFPDQRIRARALAAGAIGFLDKPFDSQALIDCIDLALSARA